MSPMLETAEQGGQALGSDGLHTFEILREPLPGKLMGVGSLPLRIGGSLQKKGLAEGPARCGLSGHSAGTQEIYSEEKPEMAAAAADRTTLLAPGLSNIGSKLTFCAAHKKPRLGCSPLGKMQAT